MIKHKSVLNILLLIGLFASFLNISAINYYVSPLGDNNNDGSYYSPWKTLTYAVSSQSPVSAGDSIILFDGTYVEGDIIEIQKSGTLGNPITLKAMNKYKAIIQGSGTVANISWHAGQLRLFKKDHWVIEGLKVQDTPSWGIIMVSCRDILLKDCWTYKTSASGIIAMPQTETENFNYNIRYHYCKVEWPQYAMVIWRESHPGECHTGSPLQEGMDMWKVDTFEIIGCEVSYGSKELIDCKSGSKNGIVRDNVVHHGNPYNIYCYSGAGIYLDGASNVNVYNNVVYGGHGAGISVADEKGGTTRNVNIYNNVVYGNGLKEGAQAGISILDTTDNVHVYNNTVTGSSQEHGIKIKAVCISLCSVRNNIVINSGTRQIDIGSKGNLHVTNNLVWGPSKIYYSGGYDNNGTVINNIETADGNQVFVDLAKYNFHLKAGSPAIDNAYAGIAPATDHDDIARPKGAGYDIGAYEYPSDDDVRVSGISLSNCPSENLEINDLLYLQYAIDPIDASNKTITWQSLDPSIAVIYQDGLLFAKGEGTTKIVVKSNDSTFTDTCEITINPAPVVAVDGVEVEPANLNLNTGKCQRIEATVLPYEANNKKVLWVSSDTTVAKVDSTGLVCGLAEGSCKIIVATIDGGYKDTCEIMVTPQPTDSIFIEAEDFSSMFGIVTEPTLDEGGGENVGWIAKDDWMEYQVYFYETGIYTSRYRIAAKDNNIQFNLSIDEVETESINHPATGTYQTWETAIGSIVIYEPGFKKIRLTAITSAWNINWLSFAKNADITLLGEQFTENQINIYPNPVKNKMLYVGFEGKEAKITIFTLSGMVAYKSILSEAGIINLENLHSGMYIIDVVTRNTSRTIKLILD